jgi:hypothetical protein
MSLRLKITQRKPPAVCLLRLLLLLLLLLLFPFFIPPQGFDLYYEALEAFEVCTSVPPRLSKRYRYRTPLVNT